MGTSASQCCGHAGHRLTHTCNSGGRVGRTVIVRFSSEPAIKMMTEEANDNIKTVVKETNGDIKAMAEEANDDLASLERHFRQRVDLASSCLRLRLGDTEATCATMNSARADLIGLKESIRETKVDMVKWRELITKVRRSSPIDLLSCPKTSYSADSPLTKVLIHCK